MSATRFGARWRLRGGAATRATTTMADQCVASASNFAVGIVVARISGPAGLGAFALAYAVWILVTTIHRSLITDPMAIMGDLRGDQKEECHSAGVCGRRDARCDGRVHHRRRGYGPSRRRSAHFRSRPAFGGSLDTRARSAGLLATDRFHAGDPEEVAHERPPVQRRAGAGVRGGLPGGSALGVRGCLGLGCGSGHCCSLRSSAVLGPPVATRRNGVSLVPLANESVVGQRTCGHLGGQPALSDPGGVLLGPAALGGLKAAQGLVVGPTFVVINAGGSFGLPEASRQLAERGRTGLVRVTRFVTGAGVVAAAACGIAVFVAAPTLLKLLYGAAFVTYAPSARVFAVSLVIAVVRRRAGSHPCHHTPSAPTLHGSVGEVGLLCRGRLCARHRLRGNRGSDGGFANRVPSLLPSCWSCSPRLVDRSRRRNTAQALRLLDTLRRRLVRNANYLAGVSPVSGGDPGDGD